MRRKEESPGLHPLERTTAERLGQIVEAAERAAEAVIDDAEAEARRYLDDARARADRLVAERVQEAGELTDSLIARAEEIRRQAEALVDALEEARSRLAGEAEGEEPASPPRTSRSHLSAVTPVARPRLVADDSEREEPLAASAAPNGTPAAARLLATQMAISGSSRQEIELRLRNGFEIEDTAAILDAILGPED
ncbi:MAG TPA: hypothetical protein VF731_13610 [Solirubrobacterales bacterium]